MATSFFRKTLLSQVSNVSLVFKSGSMDIEIMNFVSRMSVLPGQFLEKLTIQFGMLNGHLKGHIFNA